MVLFEKDFEKTKEDMKVVSAGSLLHERRGVPSLYIHVTTSLWDDIQDEL